MNFLEKDLENIIWESDNEKLRAKNLKINGKKYRQLKIGNYGILDLLTVNKRYYYCYNHEGYVPYLDITVFELKKEKVGVSAFLQALNYVKGIKTYLDQKKPYLEYKLHITLCAKEVDTNSSFIYLVDIIEESDNPNQLLNSISAYNFEYSIDGIFFNRKDGFNMVNKGF